MAHSDENRINAYTQFIEVAQRFVRAHKGKNRGHRLQCFKELVIAAEILDAVAKKETEK